MTHNARVQLFLSVDFITKEQSADNISNANFSKVEKKQNNLYHLSECQTLLIYG